MVDEATLFVDLPNFYSDSLYQLLLIWIENHSHYKNINEYLKR